MIDRETVYGLVESLYGSSDLSHDQANPILAALDRARTIESQLGAAHEEIRRLKAALELVRGMRSIRGARKVVEDAIGREGAP